MISFLDRRLRRDDSRGLGQGVTDNRRIESTFQIFIESRSTGNHHHQTSLEGYPTLFAHHRSIEHLYPLHIFHSLTMNSSVHLLNLFHRSRFLPEDYHLVNLRMLKRQQVALILRRFAYDCQDNEEYHLQQVIHRLYLFTGIDSFSSRRDLRTFSRKNTSIRLFGHR